MRRVLALIGIALFSSGLGFAVGKRGTRAVQECQTAPSGSGGSSLGWLFTRETPVSPLRAFGWGLKGYGEVLVSMDDRRRHGKLLPLRREDERQLAELVKDLRTVALFAEDQLVIDRAMKAERSEKHPDSEHRGH